MTSRVRGRKSRARAGALAAAVAAASYCVVLAAGHFAAAETTDADQPTSGSPQAAATVTKTTLPSGLVTDVLVDDAREQVFVSLRPAGSVVVVGFDGQIKETVTGLTTPDDLALAEDGGAVYVAETDGGSIGIIEPQTYALTHASLPEGSCADSIAVTAGKLWYAHSGCPGSGGDGIGVLDPATGEATDGVFTAPAGLLRALPSRPDRLVMLSESRLGVYDVGAATPSVVKEHSFTGADRTNCRDAALAQGGDLVITACGAPYRHEVFHSADLSPASAISSNAYPHAVATSADGRFVAAGVGSGWYGPDIYVTDIQGGTPGTLIRDIDLYELVADSLAFSSTGRLFAVEETPDDQNVLHGIADATSVETTMTLTTPNVVKYRGTIAGSGQLTGGPDHASVSLLRRDRTGEKSLGSVTVAADGSFTFTDKPGVTGPVTYVASYAGDDTHSPSGAKATTIVRPLPYDINADGYAETIVGVPGEDIGTDKNTGMFHVLSGTSSGATGSGSKSYHQDTAGVPGANESGDQLAYSNASGDFNGDGYADVAVSAGSENVGSSKDSGVVLVFYGSPSGLRTDQVSSLGAHHTHLGAGEEIYFGDAVAAGDFNGDGRDDLAIGAAGASQVFVATGTPDGLSKDTLTAYNKDTPGVPGDMHTDEWFGSALATGDVNGDGNSDLAIGAYLDYEDRGWSTGSVTMLYGGETGLTGAGAQRWSKDSDGVQGAPATFNPDKNDSSDAFGWQVALADFNGDGKADLAAAAPGAPVTVSGVRKRDAGTVTVLYSDGSAISATGDAHVSQQTSGMPGTSGYEDHFGTTLAAGDANGDGRAELASYSPGDNYVTVVPGGASGLAYGSAKGWTQNSSGIPGSTESGDYWGNSLRFADIKGSGRMALIVGADGENSGKGAITVIYSTSSGLTGTGAKYFSQNSTGISGTAEDGDAFGVFY